LRQTPLTGKPSPRYSRGVRGLRVHVIAVGRARGGPERDLYAHYMRRLAWTVSLKEIEVRGRVAPADLKAREGELILAALPADAKVVALDAQGLTLSSEAFAKKLQSWGLAGTGQVAFVIGGAEGLDEAVIQRADLHFSLGRVTWPHLLVRALLAEQLYRAQQILAGHPYHRG